MILAASGIVKKFLRSNHNLLLNTESDHPSPLRGLRASVLQLQGFCPKLSPVIVLEIVDTLPFDGLLQDL